MAEKKNLLPIYPASHQVGMEVPEGGSNCEKCEYVRDGKDCANKKFQQWQKNLGIKKYWVIPKAITKYCCDFFEAAKKKAKETKKSTASLLGLK